MDTDRKHEQTMVMDRPGPRRGPAAAPVLQRPKVTREAVFDIADFEAIASFAGLPARPRQAG